MLMELKILVLLQVIMYATSEEIKIATFEDVRNGPSNNITVIDVRQPEELTATGIIPGSINIPLAEVNDVLMISSKDFQTMFHHKKPEFNDPIIFTCRSGRRSKDAYEIAQQLGYKNLKNFDGGWLLWEKMINEQQKLN